jgi:hypothetical protein
MKLKFIKAEDTARNAKATVHKTGKLGFSSDAIECLDIREGKSIQFAQNADDGSDNNLYAVIHEGHEEGAFKLIKAGNYFYVNTKNMFDSLNIDYKTAKVIYDLVMIENEGSQIVKMLRREIKKKKIDMPT